MRKLMKLEYIALPKNNARQNVTYTNKYVYMK